MNKSHHAKQIKIDQHGRQNNIKDLYFHDCHWVKLYMADMVGACLYADKCENYVKCLAACFSFQEKHSAQVGL
jgi:hypothetical protein